MLSSENYLTVKGKTMLFIFIKLFKNFEFEINKHNIKQFLNALKAELENEHQENLENIMNLKIHFDKLKKRDEEDRLNNIRKKEFEDDF